MKVFSISRAGVERRWLMPAYRFGNSLMAWECALCGKLFSISVESQSAAQLPPPYIEREFRLHIKQDNDSERKDEAGTTDARAANSVASCLSPQPSKFRLPAFAFALRDFFNSTNPKKSACFSFRPTPLPHRITGC